MSKKLKVVNTRAKGPNHKKYKAQIPKKGR